MPVRATADVAPINRALTTERIAFAKMRRELRAALHAFAPPPDVDERILTFAEEFGAGQAAKVLVAKPAQFGLAAKARDPALAALTPRIVALHASNERMTTLVVERENILGAADPSRQRVYVSFGREFTIDADHQLIRYVEGGETAPFVLERVEPRDQVKRRGKVRDRER